MSESPPGSPRDPAAIHEVLADPRIRAEIAEAVLEALEARRPPSPWRRLQPWAAGAASAAVTVLAFFLPSLQEQWDRWHARGVIERYVQMGKSFMEQERYGLAEEAFSKGFELSENQRIDIEELRLQARVEQVNADPEWGRANPRGLAETDFLYLLELQRAEHHVKDRAATLSSYAVFLADEKRYGEAERTIRQSLALDSTAAGAWIHLGNVLGDLERPDEAERAYRRAIAVDADEPRAHLNLGLLLGQRERPHEAVAELERAARLDSTDQDALAALADALKLIGRRAEEDSVRRRIASLPRRPAAAAGTYSKAEAP